MIRAVLKIGISEMDSSNVNIPSTTNITKLPDEIISLILAKNEPRDIIRFSITCKQFYEIVINNDYLWKIKYSEIMPRDAVKIVEEQANCNWLKEMIQYYKLRREIYIELVSLSPKFYWRINEVSLEDVRGFFSFATETNLSFYYTIDILQNIVKKGNTLLDSLTILEPLYTLTTVYYTKIILRHLIQTYLAIKWVQMRMRGLLSPEVVITFFLQWIDPTNLYTDEEVENKIQALVTTVKNVLKKTYVKKGTEQDNTKYSEKDIVHTLTKIIYKRENFFVCPSTKVNTLNIAKVIDEDNGNIITYAVICQAVAKRLGVKCDVIAFPDHFFLQWQNNEEPNKPIYTVDLITGDIKPIRRCPFSHNASNKSQYFPESLLKYVYSSYMKSKGSIKDCKTQNATHLVHFLDKPYEINNPYKNFLPFLEEQVWQIPALNTTLNMKYIHDIHLQMILALANLNDAPNIAYQNVSIKKHRSSVTYAVGMICYHKVYNYMCVIRGWESDGNQLWIPIDDFTRHNLYFGRDQPFYRVIAGDQSERFVAQENLMAVTTPFRIHRIEDHIAKEFTHFDGFSYILNNEKMVEYPNEQQVTEIFRKRFVNVAIP